MKKNMLTSELSDPFDIILSQDLSMFQAVTKLPRVLRQRFLEGIENNMIRSVLHKSLIRYQIIIAEKNLPQCNARSGQRVVSAG